MRRLALPFLYLSLAVLNGTIYEMTGYGISLFTQIICITLGVVELFKLKEKE